MVLTLFHKRLRTFHFNVHFKMKIHLHNPKWREPSLTDVSLWGSVSMSATLLWCAFFSRVFACMFESGEPGSGIRRDDVTD